MGDPDGPQMDDQDIRGAWQSAERQNGSQRPGRESGAIARRHGGTGRPGMSQRPSTGVLPVRRDRRPSGRQRHALSKINKRMITELSL
ncbi:hypothetical protein GCM10010464_18580 [Pseudonocardia yunnanensis]